MTQPTIEEVAGWMMEAAELAYLVSLRDGGVRDKTILSQHYTKKREIFNDRAAQVDAMGWRPIVEAPIGKNMFVAISITDQYISDPWCVWQQRDGDYSRWPHKFKPTHFMPLPQPPVKK